MKTHNSDHLSAERLQAFLDGDLSVTGSASVEGHVSSCVRCSAEIDGWRLLYSDLGALASVRPHEGFHDRVMSSVAMPEGRSLAVRLRDRVSGWVPSLGDSHVSAEKLEELMEGFLPARQVARVEAHLGICASCTAQATDLQSVFLALDRLGHMGVPDDFANRVMAEVRISASLARPAGVPMWNRALALASRMVPQTREAWAAVSGVALTPAVTVGLLVYAVFSRPTMTPGALASYLWWQLSDAAAAGASTVTAFALQSLQASGMSTIYGAIASAPILVAAGFTLYAFACLFALRVLYTNLVSSRPLGRHAHVTTS
ncbi:MAG: zf-HC2 domain-containing protein [Gemmatimonadetes bacterium]|nr:zf-HC2 domain-containing protein [Gemmatimonadota bacterium]